MFQFFDTGEVTGARLCELLLAYFDHSGDLLGSHSTTAVGYLNEVCWVEDFTKSCFADVEFSMEHRFAGLLKYVEVRLTRRNALFGRFDDEVIDHVVRRAVIESELSAQLVGQLCGARVALASSGQHNIFFDDV